MSERDATTTPRCRHKFTALYGHFGPYKDQTVHYHACVNEACDRVLIGEGRQCDGKAHRREWLRGA